ncbi:hypothetical protein [Gryllotalpicola ginsengisoli]|uniref:hypothetical protein n=1 Tax=Gryllotalpicola ginsengisoli TaxID=444608 RepID=UPI0003B502DE|nr:hypothetical protein [Gryllotalpicola ginsengisoli]
MSSTPSRKVTGFEIVLGEEWEDVPMMESEDDGRQWAVDVMARIMPYGGLLSRATDLAHGLLAAQRLAVGLKVPGARFAVQVCDPGAGMIDTVFWWGSFPTAAGESLDEFAESLRSDDGPTPGGGEIRTADLWRGTVPAGEFVAAWQLDYPPAPRRGLFRRRDEAARVPQNRVIYYVFPPDADQYIHATFEVEDIARALGGRKPASSAQPADASQPTDSAQPAASQPADPAQPSNASQPAGAAQPAGAEAGAQSTDLRSWTQHLIETLVVETEALT